MTTDMPDPSVTDTNGCNHPRCDSPRGVCALTDSMIIDDGTPLVYVTEAGMFHLHDVVITTRSQLTIRAAIRRHLKGSRFAIRRRLGIRALR